MYYSNNTKTSDPSIFLRPVVTLNSNIKITKCEGENSNTNMHIIDLLD